MAKTLVHFITETDLPFGNVWAAAAGQVLEQQAAVELVHHQHQEGRGRMQKREHRQVAVLVHKKQNTLSFQFEAFAEPYFTE